MNHTIPQDKVPLVRVGLAVLVALAFDVADYFGAFIPYLGEGADALPAIINSILLWNPLPAIGLIEGASVIPPLAIFDFVPVHLGVVIYTIYKMRKEGRI